MNDQGESVYTPSVDIADSIVDGLWTDEEPEVITTEDPQPSEPEVEVAEDEDSTQDSETKESESEDVEEDNPVETDNADEQTDEPAQDDTQDSYEYKYNKQVTKLPKQSIDAIAEQLKTDSETIIARLRKGENYDVLQSKHDILETRARDAETAQPILDTLAHYSQIMNVPQSQAIPHLLNTLKQVSLDKLYNQVKTQNPNLEDITAYQQAQAMYESQVSAIRSSASTAATAESEYQDAAGKFFFENYQGVAFEDIPSEVLEAFDKRQDLEAAQAKVDARRAKEEAEQARKEAEAAKTEAEKMRLEAGAKKRATGSVKGTSTKTDRSNDTGDAINELIGELV